MQLTLRAFGFWLARWPLKPLGSWRGRLARRCFFRQLFAENQNLWYREFYKMDSFEAVAAPGPV
jgi:hypothetical protein